MKNKLQLLIMMLSFLGGFINTSAQCSTAVQPTDFTLATASTFSGTYTNAPAGTEFITVNSGVVGTNGISFQMDGQGSEQIKFNGFNQMYNSGINDITGLANPLYNSFAVWYNGVVYCPTNSRIDSYGTTSQRKTYIPYSISTVTGSGTTASPYKARIQYYADVNGNGAYNATSDILITEIITYISPDRFFRRDRSILAPTNTLATAIKLYDFRDAYFTLSSTDSSDAGYGIYSINQGLTGVTSPPSPDGGTVNTNIGFIGVTNKAVSAGYDPNGLYLGSIEITPWTNWFNSRYSCYDPALKPTGGFPEPGWVDLYNGGSMNNYIEYYDADIGYGMQYADIPVTGKGTTTYVSVYEVVSNQCPPQPTISTQPIPSLTACQNSTPAPSLTVSATKPTGSTGTLSYQWYSNTTNSNTGGTAISGATSATYTLSTATTGTFYYYVVVTDSGFGSSATSNVSTYTVNAIPSTPVVGTIVQPSCGNSTGSVSLSGLPSSGTYSITATSSTDTVTKTGLSGTTYNFSGLSAGNYTFSVSQNTCSSSSSTSAAIYSLPATPTATVTTNCVSGSTGAITVSNLPTPGPYTLTYSLNGGADTSVTTTGSTSTYSVTGLAAGTYTFKVKNPTTNGSTSCSSTSVTIYAPQSAATIGTITCSSGSNGSIVLNGLPTNYTLYQSKDGGTNTTVTSTGTTSTYTVSNLAVGSYTFTVLNNTTGCTSSSSASAVVATCCAAGNIAPQSNN